MDISKQKFLVVDDSEMVQVMIESVIKKLGANRVDRVGGGKEALTKIKKAFHDKMPYSLVTLDWEMPEMSGFDLLKLLRADPEMKKQAVLMVTTHGKPEELKQIAPLQPNGYILKPFTDEALSAKLTSLLKDF